MIIDWKKYIVDIKVDKRRTVQLGMQQSYLYSLDDKIKNHQDSYQRRNTTKERTVERLLHVIHDATNFNHGELCAASNEHIQVHVLVDTDGFESVRQKTDVAAALLGQIHVDNGQFLAPIHHLLVSLSIYPSWRHCGGNEDKLDRTDPFLLYELFSLRKTFLVLLKILSSVSLENLFLREFLSLRFHSYLIWCYVCMLHLHYYTGWVDDLLGLCFYYNNFFITCD